MAKKKQTKKKTAKRRSSKAVSKKKAKSRSTKKKTKPARKPAQAVQVEQVSIAELARRVGVTRRAVEVAIEDGRITDAVIHRSKGNGRPWKIDAALAVKLWAATTNLSHRPDDELKNRAEKAKANGGVDPSPGDGDFEPYEPENCPKLADSRARKEAAIADLKEMEVQEERGQLLRRRQVEKSIFQAVRTQREAFQSMPARLAGDLSTMEDPGEIERYLTEEIRRALEEAADNVKGIAPSN